MVIASLVLKVQERQFNATTELGYVLSYIALVHNRIRLAQHRRSNLINNRLVNEEKQNR
jgi:hypothetical protein